MYDNCKETTIYIYLYVGTLFIYRQDPKINTCLQFQDYRYMLPHQTWISNLYVYKMSDVGQHARKYAGDKAIRKYVPKIF